MAVLYWNQEYLGRKTWDKAVCLPFTFLHLNFLILMSEGKVWSHQSMVFMNCPDLQISADTGL